MATLIEKVAMTMAEYWNGGYWTNEVYYTEEQRNKWREMAKVVIAKIEESKCACDQIGCPNEKGDLCDMTAQNQKE